MSELKKLKEYHKNPRKITGKMFEALGDSLEEFGDMGGIVVNKSTCEVLGGNQRTKVFKEKDPTEVSVVITEVFKKPTKTGTVALGYVTFSGEKYGYREVEWDKEKAERANLIANKIGGFWDIDMLANQFSEEVLLSNGWESFELTGFPKFDTDTTITNDSNPLSDSMDTYLEGNIKQIVLYFPKGEFDNIVTRLDEVMKKSGTDNHTSAFLKLLEFYEKSA